MVARSISLLAALALTANAAYSNTTMTSVTPYVTTTTADVTVYTTVCPATSIITSGTKTCTSTYIITSTITSCKRGCPTQTSKPDCEKVRSDCQSQPDANQSYCAALYVQCAGITSGLNKPPVSATSSAPTSSATQDCAKVRSDCQSQPDANESYCASLYVQCAGTTSGLNSPESRTNQGITVYTTVCPATSVVSGTTSVYITTSTITSCQEGCPATATQAPGTAVATNPVVQNSQSGVALSSPMTTLATSAQPVVSSPSTIQTAPSSTTSAVQFTGAASAMKVEYAGFAGLALFFLM